MNRRRWIIVVSAVIVLIIIVLASVTFSVDKYRPRVQAELQQKLDRPVTLGHLRLRILPLSIRVDGLTVGESPSYPSHLPFATAKQVYVSVGLFSLLRGNPEIKSLTLDRPQIELIKNSAGVWNFSTLGGTNKTNPSSSGGQPGQSNQSSPFTLNQLKITDGQIGITDQSKSQPRSVYDHIDLKLTDFAPNKRFGLNVAMHFPGQGKQLLSFDGKVGPLQPGNTAAVPIDGQLSLQEFSVAGINRLAAGTIPPNTDTTASGQAEIKSEQQNISCKGNLKLENTVVRGSKIDYPIDAKYDLTADPKQNKIQIRSGEIKLGSTTFSVSGAVDAGAKPAQLTNVRLLSKNSSITELAKLAGALGVAFNPAYNVKGTVSTDVTANGPLTTPKLTGSLNAKDLVASGGQIKQPVSVPDIALALSPDVVKSNTFSVQCGSTRLDAGFTLSQYTTPNRTIDGMLKTDGANIAELLNMAQAYGVSAAQGMTGTGKLSANVRVQGPMADPSKLMYSGIASIANSTLTTPALAKPVAINSANAQFSQNAISITNLAGSVGSTAVNGTLSAKDFAAPQVQFALNANQIDTTELSQLTATKPQPQQPQRANAPQQAAKTAAAHEEPSFLNKISGSGTLAIGKVKAEDLVLTNVHTTCQLNHGVIQLSPLTADIFGGKENGTVTLDMRPANPACGLKVALSGVDTNAMLSAMSSVKNTLYGSLAANTNLNFVLVSSNQLARTLNGTLNFNVTNGQLKNINILSELSKVGKFLTPASNGGSGTAIKHLSGALNIVNGVASTNNLQAVLDAGSLSANGWLNLVSQAVNMHVNAVLSNGISQTVGGTHIGGFLNTALANNKGELVLPVIVTGTAEHPVFAPDVEAIAKMKMSNLLPTTGNPAQLTNGILGAVAGKKGAGGIINGILGGGQQGQQQKQQNNQQQKNQNPLDSIFNRLNKKK